MHGLSSRGEHMSPAASFGDCPLSELSWRDPEILECPYPYYQRLRVEAPVFNVPGTHEYLVSRWEDVVYVLAHPELFSNDVSYSTSGDGAMSFRAEGAAQDGADFQADLMMAAADPPAHTRKRQNALGLVAPPALRGYEPMIRRHCDDLIDAFIDRREVEFSAEFAELLPIHVICDILGLDHDDIDDLKRWGSFEPVGARYLPDDARAVQAEAMQRMLSYVQDAVRRRIEEPTDDYLSAMIARQTAVDGRTNLTYLTSEATLILFAGNVTTTHMIASAMLLLLQNPDELRRVHDDRQLIASLLDETMRIESPLRMVPRYATRDTVLNGVPVPAGSLVYWMAAAANRDDVVFDEPARFEVARPRVAKDHLGFGRGIHRCPGAPLARLEGTIAFNAMFDRLDNLRLADQNAEVRHLQSIQFRAPSAVRMRFDRTG
jgi:cytochrome P450